jgi:hypothetical protein
MQKVCCSKNVISGRLAGALETMSMKTNLLFLMTLLAPVVLAQAPKPCSAPENRQFDFWVGEWTVTTPDGKVAGKNSITKIAGGCALLEQWTGASGFNGKSLNAWDAIRKKWHQTWVDSSGTVLYLDGEFRNGKMTLEGKSGNTLQRIVWTPLPDGPRQVWEQSTDEGKTWTVVFDGLYKRAQ